MKLTSSNNTNFLDHFHQQASKVILASEHNSLIPYLLNGPHSDIKFLQKTQQETTFIQRTIQNIDKQEIQILFFFFLAKRVNTWQKGSLS